MNTIDFHNGLKVLERCIMDLAPPHFACENAPNTYADLIRWYETQPQPGIIPVYSGGCDKTIYSSKQVNHAFRAWHDAIHIAFKLRFTRDDELEVARHHVNELLCWCIGHGVDGDTAYNAASIVYADVAGQVEYYYYHGKYVDNQSDFVRAYIDNDFNLPEGEY